MTRTARQTPPAARPNMRRGAARAAMPVALLRAYPRVGRLRFRATGIPEKWSSILSERSESEGPLRSIRINKIRLTRSRVQTIDGEFPPGTRRRPFILQWHWIRPRRRGVRGEQTRRRTERESAPRVFSAPPHLRGCILVVNEVKPSCRAGRLDRWRRRRGRRRLGWVHSPRPG